MLKAAMERDLTGKEVGKGLRNKTIVKYTANADNPDKRNVYAFKYDLFKGGMTVIMNDAVKEHFTKSERLSIAKYIDEKSKVMIEEGRLVEE